MRPGRSCTRATSGSRRRTSGSPRAAIATSQRSCSVAERTDAGGRSPAIDDRRRTVADTTDKTDTTDKLRLGGMALRNGLLVHGPKHWAAAVRADDGTIVVASGPKPRVE